MTKQPATPVPAKARLLIVSFIPLFLAIGFLQIILGAWLVTVGFTAVQAGTLISVLGISVILTSIPLGIVSDVYGRKYLILSGTIAGAAVVYLIRSPVMNMVGPLIDSFSMTIFPPEQRGLVSALSNIMFRLPNSVSTYFGGFILGYGILQLPFYVATAFYIVGIAGFVHV